MQRTSSVTSKTEAPDTHKLIDTGFVVRDS